MNDFIKDKLSVIDYSNCITNLTSSIEKYYGRFFDGIAPHYETNKVADGYLDKKEYKNVIIFVFDAMGDSILKKNLKENSYLRRKEVSTFNSTYPPTTANCTTAYRTGLNPVTTGWLGWATCFKDENLCVDNFPNVDSLTKEPFHTEEKIAYRKLPIKDLGSIIEEKSGGKVKYHDVHCVLGNDGFKTLSKFKKEIVRICNSDGFHYVYAYWHNPDTMMHMLGTKNIPVKVMLSLIASTLKYIEKHTFNTIGFVSADHSQVDVKPIDLFEYKDITDLMEYPYTCDSRTPFFFIKKGKEKEFEDLFNKYFKDDYLLITKDEAIENHIFGFGPENGLYRDIIGDYIGLAYTDKYFRMTPNYTLFKGHHAGLTKDEMTIPLIVIEGEKHE